LAGTSNLGYGAPGFYGGTYAPGDIVNSPTTLLFDNRIYYTQSTMDVNFIQSPRTIFTFGGDGFWLKRQAKSLAGTNGYMLRGAVQRRLTKTRSITVNYQHMHFDFPPSFGESDIDSAELGFATKMGKRWTFAIGAGAFRSQVQVIETVALDPVIAALLGQGFSRRAFYRENISPSGRANLTGQFKSTSISFEYNQTVSPGNGVYLTSKQRIASAGLSYTALRNWSFGLTGGYATLNGLGQGLQQYATFTAGANASYRLTHAIHAIARIDARDQQIDIAGYSRTGYRATIGLSFSPGDIPLSLW